MAQTVWNSFWEKITVNYLDRSPPKGGVSKIEFHSLIIHMFFSRGLKHDAPQRWMTSLATICLYILFFAGKSIDFLIKTARFFSKHDSATTEMAGWQRVLHLMSQMKRTIRAE